MEGRGSHILECHPHILKSLIFIRVQMYSVPNEETKQNDRFLLYLVFEPSKLHVMKLDFHIQPSKPIQEKIQLFQEW